MANTKKKTSTTKKTEVEVAKVQPSATPTSDLDEMKQMIKEMSEKMAEMQKINLALSNENQALKERGPKVIEVPSKVDDKVYVVHLRDYNGTGLTTHIALSSTQRDLTTFGEIMTLSVQEFEELAGSFKHYFTAGVLAIDPRSIVYAEERKLPVYDRETEEKFNAEVLAKLGNMTNDELKNLFESLSYANQQGVLTYWLNKCYNKDPKFYVREKMVFLDKISESTVFEDIIFEMDENARKKTKQVNTVGNLGVI